MAQVLFYLKGLPPFLVLLMVLVAAHELGHYLFARLFNMGVEEFSVGMFGKRPILRYMRRTYRIKLKEGDDPYLKFRPDGINLESGGEDRPVVVIDTPNGRILEEYTDFTVRPWPIGGFVRIKGMMPQPNGSEIHIPGGFYSKPPWQRLIVLLAGPVFSVLGGVLAMIPLFMIQGEYRSSNEPIIGQVMESKAADLAGLREGDRILSINGQPIKTFYDIMVRVQNNPGKPLEFVYNDAGKVKTTTVTPYLNEEPTEVVGPDLEPTGEIANLGMMGVIRNRKLVRLTLADATVTAFRVPVQDVVNLLGIAKRPSLGKDSVGGPLTMLKVTSNAVDDGTAEVVMVAALISISVGIFNLLPIYPLDGGQMVVALAELLRGGRRLSMRVQELVGTIGMALVLLMVICVFGIDFMRLGAKDPPPLKLKPSPGAPAKK